MLLVAAGSALALIVLIMVTTARHTPLVRRPTSDPSIHIGGTGRVTPPTFPGGQTAQTPNPASTQASHVFGQVMVDVLLGLLSLLVLWLLIAAVIALIRRWRAATEVRHSGPLPDVEDAVIDAVSEAAGRQQQVMFEGTPTNAIVACWVDLEHAVGAAGVERQPSETSAELTIRVLDALDVDRAALRTLGALYREARFSAHPLTEDDRRAAYDALGVLHRSLPVGSEGAV